MNDLREVFPPRKVLCELSDLILLEISMASPETRRKSRRKGVNCLSLKLSIRKFLFWSRSMMNQGYVMNIFVLILKRRCVVDLVDKVPSAKLPGRIV